MNNIELEQLLNLKLNSEKITDYAPNGLQVEGKVNVHKIITGVTASQALINDINLYSYHLPLDIHSELGNNAQLAELLGIEQLHPLEKSPMSIPVWGELRSPMTGEEFAEKIEKVLNRKPLICIENGPCLIRKVGICTGGGQGYIDLAAAQGCDAFVTGEVSEQTIHSAREQGIHFFAAGHHATERYGIKILGEWLSKAYGFDVEFKDIDNPA